MVGVRYAQCWEDPRTLCRGLEVCSDDDVVSIASGGDNSFALLLSKPRSLTLVDTNPTQIYLVELKRRALQNFDYEDFVAFLGARPCRNRLALYRHLRPLLSEEARGYWDRQYKDLLQGILHCGKFEKYFGLFRRLVLPLIHNRKAVEQLLAASSLDQQRTFYGTVWDSRRWQWLFYLFFGKTLLGRLGRDPAFFQYVQLHDVAGELLRRTRRGATEVLIRDNFFIEYILTGDYRNLTSAHPYLREANFQRLRDRVGQMHLFRGSLEEYLNSLPPRTVSSFNLSDIVEYMSEVDFERNLQAILRVCRAGARLAFWTLFVPRPVPPPLVERIDPRQLESDALSAADRTFFYGGFHAWQVSQGS